MQFNFRCNFSHVKGWTQNLIPYLAFCFPLFFPLPKIIGKSIRQGMGVEIIISFIILLWGFLLIRERKWIPKSILFLLFGAGLSALWANPLSEWQVVSGSLFFSDSSQYYSDALRLMNGIEYSAFSARHPFGTMFLSSIMWLTGGNCKLSFMIITLIAAASTWMAAEEVWRKWGSLPATFFSILLFLYFRRFIGIPDCENLGYIFGCLSFTLFLKSSDYKNKWIVGIGFLALLLGLSTRPGAFLVIPLILGWWFCISNRSRSKQSASLFFCVFAAVFILFLNLISNKIASIQNNGLFSNFSYTLYGITNGGKGWEFFQETHPMEKFETEVEAENVAFNEAINTFVTNPKLTLLGILNSFGEFFSLKPVSVFGFLGFDLYNDPVFGSERYQKYFGYTCRFVMLLLTLFGLYTIIGNRKKVIPGLLLSIFSGVLFSIPFLPPNDAGMMRVYIVTIPYILILPVIGLHKFLKIKTDEINLQNGTNVIAPITMCTILFVMIFSSLLIFGLGHHLDIETRISCPQTNEIGIVSKLYKGSYINLVEDNSISASDVLYTRYSDFSNSYSLIPVKQLIGPLDTIAPKSLLFNSIDLITGKQIWISMPSSDMEWEGKTIILCGNFSNEFSRIGTGFFVAESVSLYEKQ